ncbi:MAG: dihydropteroate synthase [bacterium]|nr:dihydropteroate synthase [bacterium]
MAFPQIMGVVNVTPDSFSDGGRYLKTDDAVRHALVLVEEGADILDVGGESSRPGAKSITESVELERVLPVIRGIREKNTNTRISIDTIRASVARVSVAEGANIINDISAGRNDDGMFDAAAELDVPLVLMHMQGGPHSMQDNPTYTDVVAEVRDFLQDRVRIARAAGVKNIMVDPGIGFGKLVEHNLALLSNLNTFAEIAPVVVGLSRKRFLGTLLNIAAPIDRDVATMMMHALLINKNVAVIRVHNVLLASQLKTLQSMLS